MFHVRQQESPRACAKRSTVWRSWEESSQNGGHRTEGTDGVQRRRRGNFFFTSHNIAAHQRAIKGRLRAHIEVKIPLSPSRFTSSSQVPDLLPRAAITFNAVEARDMHPRKRQHQPADDGRPGPSGVGEGGSDSHHGPIYRAAFLQALMQRQYMKEEDAKALYRRVTDAASGECRAQSKCDGRLSGDCSSCARLLRGRRLGTSRPSTRSLPHMQMRATLTSRPP